MGRFIKLFKQYKSIILYGFFGGCTTLVNIVAYAFSTRICHIGTVGSTIFAWVMAVIFAYVTNRRFVFESKVTQIKGIIREIIAFFSCRLLTGALDLLMMYVFVDMVGINDMLMKIINNIIVIILNYIASKLIIFSNGGKHEQEV